MSDVYIRRLSRIQREHDVTRDATAYVIQNWQKQDIFHDIQGTNLEDLRRAVGNLDAIFLMRLFSMFEGLLKENLAQYHPGIHVSEDARAIWLIDHVAPRQSPPISAVLKGHVHDIRRYRNDLTHLNDRPLFPIPFTTALARLSKFVGHLPEPR